MSKELRKLSPEKRIELAALCYKQIKKQKIDFKIKGKTVLFINPKQLDNIFYSSVVQCDPNELLRLCSQVVN